MSGATPPLPNTPSWCGVQLKKAQAQLYLYPYLYFESLNMPDTSVSTVTRLRAEPPRFDSRQRAVIFFFRHRVQTGSEAHPASYQIGNGALSLEVKRLGREADHSPSPFPRSRMHGAVSPLRMSP